MYLLNFFSIYFCQDSVSSLSLLRSCNTVKYQGEMLPTLSVVLCLNATDGNQSLLEHMEVPKGNRIVRSGEQELAQVAGSPQRNQDQELHKDLPQEVNHHHLEKLHQEPSLAPPESIEESADREVDLVLCPTAADETPANQSLVDNSAERLTHGRLTPDSSGVTVGLSSQLEEVLDQPSTFSNDLLVHKSEEDVQHKSSKMDMESLYPQYEPNSSLTPTKVELKCEYSDAVSSRAAVAATHQTKGNLEDLTLLATKCKV